MPESDAEPPPPPLLTPQRFIDLMFDFHDPLFVKLRTGGWARGPWLTLVRAAARNALLPQPHAHPTPAFLPSRSCISRSSTLPHTSSHIPTHYSSPMHTRAALEYVNSNKALAVSLSQGEEEEIRGARKSRARAQLDAVTRAFTGRAGSGGCFWAHTRLLGFWGISSACSTGKGWSFPWNLLMQLLWWE